MADQPLVVVITGMAGAGRSTAAKAFEDLGFFVVDNLPPSLIARVVEVGDEADKPRSRLAVVVDSRTGVYSFEVLERAVLRMHEQGVRTSVVFLDADDRTLLRRFKETRRPHPVRADTLEEAIRLERAALEHLRGNADLIVDTTEMNIHELREFLMQAFSAEQPRRPMRVAVVSFGFKHGTPRDLDLLFDARFLPNPYWVPELRGLTGRDRAVADYVLERPDAHEFVDRIADLLSFLVPRYVKEGRAYLAVGVGCTGGRHRSVAIAEELGRRLDGQGVDVTIRHKDAER